MALRAARPSPTTNPDAPSLDVDRYLVLPKRALRGVLASLALVMLIASLDSTAVGTALPRMSTLARSRGTLGGNAGARSP